jgi:nicotinamidase-related amidase
LLIADVRKEFDESVWGSRNNSRVEQNVAILAILFYPWRQMGRPVFYVQHLPDLRGSPLRAGSPGSETKDSVEPLADEPVVKNMNSAFMGADLEDWPPQKNREVLIVTGLTTSPCVEPTTRIAGATPASTRTSSPTLLLPLIASALTGGCTGQKMSTR